VRKQAMNKLVIDNKSYVVVPEKSYRALQKKAALKTRSEKILTIEEARVYSKKLIKKWASEK
jgi:hypothetical protein